MSLHATFIEHTFVSILALYVTLECAVTILQTRAAEKSCGRVPEGFEKKLTLAGIRKAADYTGNSPKRTFCSPWWARASRSS